MAALYESRNFQFENSQTNEILDVTEFYKKEKQKNGNKKEAGRGKMNKKVVGKKRRQV